MTDVRVVYHYWNYGPADVWRDMENPLILSIATLRAFDATVPIDVIDDSVTPQEWAHYADLLRFRVVRVPGDLPPNPGYIHDYAYRTMNRVGQVWNHSHTVPERIIMFCDSDILWRKSPRLVEPVDRFVGHPSNAGHYYYDKASNLTARFLDTYRAFMIRSLARPLLVCDMQAVYRDYVSRYDELGYLRHSDENVYRYIVRRGHVGDEVKFMTEMDNYMPVYPVFHAEARNCHLLKFCVGAERGMFAYYVVDFYEAISRVLQPGDIKDIFAQALYQPCCVSFAHMNVLFGKPKMRT